MLQDLQLEKLQILTFLFRLPNGNILDKKEFFTLKIKQEGKKIKKYRFSFLKINSDFTSSIKLPTSLFYMIWEQEIYIFEWS